MAEGSKWIYFDRILSLYKDSTDPEAIQRGFRLPLHAQAFRSLAYNLANVSTLNEVAHNLVLVGKWMTPFRIKLVL